jgi:hypothetical protein
VAVSAGFAHTCAILNDATVRCWGDNSAGQLGLGDKTQRNAPITTAVNLGPDRTAIGISSSANHTCVVLDDGKAKCWGQNNVGQLGLGDIDNRGDDSGEMGNSLPAIFLGNDRTARAIVTSPRSDLGYTCALLDDASVKCWGENGYAQLGQGDQYNRGGTSVDMTNLNAVDVGKNQTVASISIGAARDHSPAPAVPVRPRSSQVGSLGTASHAPRQDSTPATLLGLRLRGSTATAGYLRSPCRRHSTEDPFPSTLRFFTDVAEARRFPAVSANGP